MNAAGLGRVLAGAILFGALLVLCGCPPTENPSAPSAAKTEIIRVRLVAGASQVSLAATGRPRLSVGDDPAQRELIFPAGASVAAWRSGGLWHIGAAPITGGVLTLTPGDSGVLSVNDVAYRGSLRLVPVGDGSLIDVINDVPIDDYLKGVLASELYRPWHIQTYFAQAVVARTYALYQSHTEGLGRYWDMWPDERSQVYGGIPAETDKSRSAAAETAGLVLTYGPGEGTIFETYFSSDCGGVTQSASDAFDGPRIPPLQSHAEPGCDAMSPHANWGPIAISRPELTRRLRLWAVRRSPQRPETDMAEVADVQLAAVNPLGRPTRFRITDAAGATYILAAEEMRTAFNTEPTPGNMLPSSFCKVTVQPDQDQVVFYDGHGLGHGVGMCQWCAEQHATDGWDYVRILMDAYPQAKLARAY